ncbi:MAG: tetratricopeptide repeat protein [Gemmatimonadota bacterium]
MKNLIREVHRRSLWQVLGIYLAGSWVALQVVEQLAEAASLPEWVRPFALALLILGFPLVMATAFVQEGLGTKTPEPPLQSPGDVGDASRGPAPAPTGAVGLFTWKNAIMGGIGALTVWGLVALVWVIRGGGQAVQVDGSLPGGPLPLQARIAAIAARVDQDLPTVAVLPFEDSGSEDEYVFFADGVHEDLLTNLSKVNSLIVLARATVMPYRDSELTIQQIAEELGASAIVTGSVRRGAGDVRINVQLVDPITSVSLWAERYDRRLEDIFAVQSEIAFAVATGLRAKLSPVEEARLATVPTDDLVAFDLYTRGRQAYFEYEQDANQRALKLFRDAIARDSAYGQAWAGLADGLAQTVQSWGASIEWADSALVAANRAIALTPESSEAYKALGLALFIGGRSDESASANERALELNPNNANAANNLAVIYGASGRPAEAISLYKLSGRLRPHALTRTNRGWTYAAAGFPEQARDMAALDREFTGETTRNLNVLSMAAWVEGDYRTILEIEARKIEIEPGVVPTSARAALLALAAGDLDLAEEWGQIALASENEGEFWFKNTNTTLGQVALARGDTAAARRYLRRSLAQLEEAEDRGADNAWLHYQYGVAYAALGDADRAIEEAETALVRGLIWPVVWDEEPAFDLIRDDPRYLATRAEVQRRWDSERAKIARQEGIPLPTGR